MKDMKIVEGRKGVVVIIKSEQFYIVAKVIGHSKDAIIAEDIAEKEVN